MNLSKKEYLESLKQDISNLDLFCDEKLTNVFLEFVINENIDVLTDLIHQQGKHNTFVMNKINFLNTCLKEIKCKGNQ